MDISSPGNVSLDQATLELISDAKVLARQVNECRPLSQEVIRNIEKEFLGERVYNSNAIEGNTLTLRETRSVLQVGSIVDESRKREAAEALNLAKAIAEVQEMIQKPESWSDIHRFTAVHRTILSGIKDDAAGIIRPGSVRSGLSRSLKNFSDRKNPSAPIVTSHFYDPLCRHHAFRSAGAGDIAS